MGIAGNLAKKEARILRDAVRSPVGPFKMIDRMVVTARNSIRGGASGMRSQRSFRKFLKPLSLLRGQGAIGKIPLARKAKSRVRAVTSRARRRF